MTVLAPAWRPTCTPLLLLLLLLLLSPSLLGTSSCSFSHDPISSTFKVKFSQLSPYLLKDYPVTVAANLQDEQFCGKLWHLVLAQRWMERLKTVAGLKMRELLETVNTEIHFVTSCAFQPLPSCLRFVQTNISHLLQDTMAQLEAMKPWITHQNLSQCLELRCQPDPSTPLPPRSPRALEATELPTPPAHSRLLLLLLLLLLPAALLLLSTLWCLRRRRRGRRRHSPRCGTPVPEEPVSLRGGGGAGAGSPGPGLTLQGPQGPPPRSPQDMPLIQC